MDSETINQGAEVATADSSCSGVLEKIECGTSQSVSAEDRTELEFNKVAQTCLMMMAAAFAAGDGGDSEVEDCQDCDNETKGRKTVDGHERAVVRIVDDSPCGSEVLKTSDGSGHESVPPYLEAAALASSSGKSEASQANCSLGDNDVDAFRAKLASRARRFGLPPPDPNASQRTHAPKLKHLGSALVSESPSKRPRQASVGPCFLARTTDDAIDLLPGQWRCCFSGKDQIHNVERSKAGKLVCVIWERGVETNLWERKLKPFRIGPSADGRDLLWGCKGNVWLDLQTCSQTEVVYVAPAVLICVITNKA